MKSLLTCPPCGTERLEREHWPLLRKTILRSAEHCPLERLRQNNILQRQNYCNRCHWWNSVGLKAAAIGILVKANWEIKITSVSKLQAMREHGDDGFQLNALGFAPWKGPSTHRKAKRLASEPCRPTFPIWELDLYHVCYCTIIVVDTCCWGWAWEISDLVISFSISSLQG